MSNSKLEQFKHPFSKRYWQLATAEFRSVHALVLAAILIALRVAVKSINIPVTADVRINVAFFISALAAMIYGPVVAVVASAISDTLGCMLFPTGPYFFPYILLEIAGSVIFALFLYRAKITLTRVILSRFCICFFVNIALNAPIMALFYQMMLGKPYMMFQIPRIVKNLVLFPIEGILLAFFLALVVPVCNKIGAGYSTVEKMKFTKKVIALIVCLVIVSTTAVVAYSINYYNTTSMSASYSKTERLEKNNLMNELIKNDFKEYSDIETVAVIQSAYTKFMDNKTTYTVSLYSVDMEEFERNVEEFGEEYTIETLQGYSKTPATKDDALTLLTQFTIESINGENEVISIMVMD